MLVAFKLVHKFLRVSFSTGVGEVCNVCSDMIVFTIMCMRTCVLTYVHGFILIISVAICLIL